MSPAVLAPPAPLDHTRRYLVFTKDDIERGATIIFASDATERRAQLPVWTEVVGQEPGACIVIERQERETIQLNDRGRNRSISLLDEGALDRLVGGSNLYLDISGLAHQVWAPILRAIRRTASRLRVVYVEPASYKPHPSPSSPTVFDLSTGFTGLAPLPGFARLLGPEDETKTLLVAMLGFEGSRPQHLALQIDTVPKVIPVVGVPGFRLEYPAFTVACNRTFLDEYRAHGDIRFARASCPFEAYQTLADLRRDYPEHYLYIAPVGTKPHALGAVCFAIDNPTTTELMYDHPIRKAGRTDGFGVIHVYEMGLARNA